MSTAHLADQGARCRACIVITARVQDAVQLVVGAEEFAEHLATVLVANVVNLVELAKVERLELVDRRSNVATARGLRWRVTVTHQ